MKKTRNKKFNRKTQNNKIKKKTRNKKIRSQKVRKTRKRHRGGGSESEQNKKDIYEKFIISIRGIRNNDNKFPSNPTNQSMD